MLAESRLANQDDIKLLFQEIITLSRLQSPAIVQLVGVCFDPLCMLTEYVANGSLFSVLRDARVRLAWEPATGSDEHSLTAMAADVARGVASIHALETCHRDLKSGNVLVTDTFRLKICDVGIARRMPKQRARRVSTKLRVTRYFAAPEL